MLIAASGGVGILVMAEICQRVLDGLGMPVEWALGIVVLIFRGFVTPRIAAAIEL